MYTPDEQALIDRYESLRELQMRKVRQAKKKYPNNPLTALHETMNDLYAEELEQSLVELEHSLPESYVHPDDQEFFDD